MEFYMFLGAQSYEYDRPEIIAKPGAKVEIAGKIYSLILRPSTTKVVISE